MNKESAWYNYLRYLCLFNNYYCCQHCWPPFFPFFCCCFFPSASQLSMDFTSSKLICYHVGVYLHWRISCKPEALEELHTCIVHMKKRCKESLLNSLPFRQCSRHLLAQKSFQLAPKKFSWALITVSIIWISPKKLHLSIGQVKNTIHYPQKFH